MSGVGRGRGWLGLNKNQNIQNSKPGPVSPVSPMANSVNSNHFQSVKEKLFIYNPKYTNLITAISAVDENDDGILLNQKLKRIIEGFEKDCELEEDVREAFENIHAKCLEEDTFAVKAIDVISTATFSTFMVHGLKVRNLFIHQFQKDFENAKNLQSTNPEAFRNIVRMLGGFYKKAKMLNGQQMKFLTAPLIIYMEMLLDNGSELDSRLYTELIITNGYEMQLELPNKFLEMMVKLRQTLATNDKLTVNGKLLLMMCIDIVNNRFSGFSNELHQFYFSQLKDSATNLFKKLKPELSIETNYQNKVFDSFQSTVNVLQRVNTSASTWDEKEVNEEEVPVVNCNKKVESSSMASIKEPSGMNNIGTWELPKVEKTPRPILGAGARFKNQEKQNELNWRERSDEKSNDKEWGNKHDNRKENNWEKKKSNPRRPTKGWEHDDRTDNDYW